MTISKIVFFNGHQHGDLANNRGVVNYITPYLKELDLFCVHMKNPDSIYFNDNVKIHNPSTYPDSKLLSTHIGHIKFCGFQSTVANDTLFINLWIGLSPSFKDNRKDTGIGITRQSLMNQTIEIINIIKQHTNIEIPYPTDAKQTMPSSIKHPTKNHKEIEHFTQKVLPNYRKKILISNGHVESCQCPPFNIGDLLIQGGIVQKYRDVLFILTAESQQTSSNNIVLINNIVPIPNLNEIDYISRYCDVLITRASGPGCMFSTQENFYDTSKTFISFTTNKNIALEALSSVDAIKNESWGNENTAKMIWSNNFSSNNICSIIEKTII